jgi:hypothetical protein
MLLFGFNGRATRNFLILLISMHYILFCLMGRRMPRREVSAWRKSPN